MKELNVAQQTAVSGGTFVCGETIPVSVIQNIHSESLKDAWKAAVVTGLLTGMASSWMNASMSSTLMASGLVASWAFNLEYMSSMNILSYAPSK